MQKVKRLIIGSAVLTAMQARSMSLEFTAKAAPLRAFNHFLKGGRFEDWWAEFWRNYGLMEAREIAGRTSR